MPEREATSGAGGSYGLAVFRDVDWEDYVASVRYLPTLARNEGTSKAIAWAQSELRSMLALFSQATPSNEEDKAAHDALAYLFDAGELRLLCDDDAGGYAAQTDHLSVILRELVLPSSKAVFEKAATKEAPYAPSIPPAA